MTNASMNGVVVVDKPGGWTSHDVVARLRRIYGTKRVGHTGTLDPLATGVLVVCLGQATRIVEYLTAESKEYVAGVTFGVTTDSQDSTGTRLSEKDASSITEDAIQTVLPGFRGSILQTPPMVSALHHEGKRLYELARQGIEVERKARPVDIYALEMTDFQSGGQAKAQMRVECSTGTYIRTLAADIGDALGVGGIMDSLRRTRVGVFTLADAYSLESLAEMGEAGRLYETLRSIPSALKNWPRATLNELEIERIRRGQSVSQCVAGEDEKVLLLDSIGEPIALARQIEAQLAPFKVFAG